MQKSILEGVVGSQPIGSMFVADSVKRHTLGTIVTASDSYWGGGEYIYVRAGGNIRQFGLVQFSPTYDSGTKSWFYSAIEVTNTANLGRSVGVAMVGMASGDYGWVQITGIVPINCTASVAADTAIGIVAAGQAGAISAGKQVCGARVVLAATTTIVKVANAAGLTTKLSVADTDGWFIGIYLTGTGIAAGTTVVAIDPSERTVTLSLATTAAIVGGNVSGNLNNATVFYNVAHINRPFAQGQIL